MHMFIHRFTVTVAATLVLACTEREATRQPNEMRADADASFEQDASTGSKDESRGRG